MSATRLLAIMAIFVTVTVAWFLLAAVTSERTEEMDQSLSAEMKSLWGPPVLAQTSPWWSPAEEGDEKSGTVAPAASRITAEIAYEPRRKGLLWYGSFTVDFVGRYTLPADPRMGRGHFHFHLPAGSTPMDLAVTVDGQTMEPPYEQKVSGRIEVPMDRQAQQVVEVAFKTRGQDAWLYCPGPATVKAVEGRNPWQAETPTPSAERVVSATGELSHFDLTVTTDFREIDYPRSSQSPTRKAQPGGKGMTASWQYKSLITRQPMGMVMPTPPNAGPVITRMSLFAPVSLLFFFTVLFTVVVLKRVPLHPMHYLFISAAFLAFHLLLAYLADKMKLEWSFWVCAGVSVLLVVTYMRLVAGVKFACTYVASAQLVYLVGFAYAFFWTGWTGLAVVIGAIATLFVLMQATGRVDWQTVFQRRAPHPPPIPAATQPPAKENRSAAMPAGQPPEIGS